MNTETHFDYEEIVSAIQVRTQEHLKNLTLEYDAEKIKKLVWALYPFTSDLVMVPKTSYKLKEGYVSVTYPADKGDLHIFNQMPELYFRPGLDNNILFHENPIVGIKQAPAEQISNNKVFTRIYLGEENIGYPTSSYTEVAFPLLGPVRFVPKDGGLDDVTYALYTYRLDDFKLEHKNLGAPSLLKPDEKQPDRHILGYLESVRFVSLLILDMSQDGCRKLVTEWFNDPRFLVAPGTVTKIGGVSLEYPFCENQLRSIRANRKTNYFAELKVRFNGQPIQPEEPTQSVSTSPDTHSEWEAKKVPQLLLLKEINVLRDKLEMPQLKARWSPNGDIIDFEEEPCK